MKPLSLARTSSATSIASPRRPGAARKVPPASRWDCIWRTRRPRRSVGPHGVCFLMLILVSSIAYGLLQPAIARSNTDLDMDRLYLLPDNEIVTGTVQDVKSGVIQVDIGKLKPLFLSDHAARDTGIWPVKPGDKLKIVLSNENEPVAFHHADMPGWDITIKGQLIQPLRGDHSLAVLQTEWGTNLPYKVTEYARHKVQNIPVGVPALFLFDVQGVIVDATAGSEQALLDTLSRWGEDRKRGHP